MSSDTERLQAQVDKLTRQVDDLTSSLQQAGERARRQRQQLKLANEDRTAMAVLLLDLARGEPVTAEQAQAVLGGAHLNVEDIPADTRDRILSALETNRGGG